MYTIYWCVVLLSSVVYAHQTLTWNIDRQNVNGRRLRTKRVHSVNGEEIQSFFNSTNSFIDIPVTSQGQICTFNLLPSFTLSSQFKHKFPGLKSFHIVGVNYSTAGHQDRYINCNDLHGEISWSSITGFHAQLFGHKGKIIYVDPFKLHNRNDYIVYTSNRLMITPIGHTCSSDSHSAQQHEHRKLVSFKPIPHEQLEIHLYRIVVSASKEYVDFYGGTLEGALSGIQTSLNRVNGIFRVDLGIQLQIVEQSSLLIDVDGTLHIDNDANALNILPSIILSKMGIQDFDLGHLFTTAGGGNAAIGAVCHSSQKMRAFSGLASPKGDSFNVDFLAHEIAHQFGATHTYSGVHGSCSSSQLHTMTNYEPGSGSTIMSYAGICQDDNVQRSSDPYFHVANLQQVYDYIHHGVGNKCGIRIQLDLNASDIEHNANLSHIVNKTVVIPKSTPFMFSLPEEMERSGHYYNWEQIDLGPDHGVPVITRNENHPMFRSISPNESSRRVFPVQLVEMTKQTYRNTLMELLPGPGATFNFALVERSFPTTHVTKAIDKSTDTPVNLDNLPVPIGSSLVVGHWTMDTLTLNTVDVGPLEILFPNTSDDTLYTNGDEIRWNVHETDALSPTVDIYLSINNGTTFDITLASNITNNGKFVVGKHAFEEQCELDSISSINARFMIASTNTIGVKFVAISTGIAKFSCLSLEESILRKYLLIGGIASGASCFLILCCAVLFRKSSKKQQTNVYIYPWKKATKQNPKEKSTSNRHAVVPVAGEIK